VGEFEKKIIDEWREERVEGLKFKKRRSKKKATSRM
jgi:hypothetical protein